MVEDLSLLDRCLEVELFPPVVRPPRLSSRRLKDRLTEVDRQNMVEAYRSGESTMKQLAARYRISDYSVRLILRRAGVVSARAQMSEELCTRVRELRGGGVSVAEIARRFGIAETSVRLMLC